MYASLTNSEWEYAAFVPLISQLTRFLTALQTIFENTESFRELLACIFLQYWDCTTLQNQSRTEHLGQRIWKI